MAEGLAYGAQVVLMFNKSPAGETVATVPPLTGFPVAGSMFMNKGEFIRISGFNGAGESGPGFPAFGSIVVGGRKDVPNVSAHDCFYPARQEGRL